MNIKVSGELSDVLIVLRQMAMFETKLAELYSLCASTWEEHAEFWLDIWRDEIRHAQYISRIIDIVSEKPESFEKGRPYTVFTVNAVVAGIQSRIDMLKKGEITEEKILFFANDMENGFIEEKYSEIVMSGEKEYQNLMRTVVSDTQKHQTKIDDKIKKRIPKNK